MAAKILVWLVFVLHSANGIDIGVMNVLTKEFGMLHPYLVCPESIINETQLIRGGLNRRTVGFFKGNFSSLLQDGSDGNLLDKDLIVCIDDFSFNASQMINELVNSCKQNGLSTWIIVSKLILTDSELELGIQINQRVFFLDVNTNMVSESYSLGEEYEPVTNIIGYTDGSTFQYVNRESFLARRSNLHGKTLKVLARPWQPFFYIPKVWLWSPKSPDWKESENEMLVRDVTKLKDRFRGIYVEVLKMFESSMNFTSQIIIKRSKKERIGSFRTYENAMKNNEADILGTGFILTLKRFNYLKFLLPITLSQHGMLINKNNLETISWLTFVNPLTMGVWVALFLTAFVLLCGLQFLEADWSNTACFRNLRFQCFINLVGDYWMVATSFFGRPPTDKSRQYTKESISVFFLCLFFLGNLVFMSYKSSLTAELSVVRKNIPFENLEELFESDYRMVRLRYRKFYFTIFESSNEEDTLNKINEKYIKPYSQLYVFDTMGQALNEVVVTPKRTFMMALSEVSNFPEYMCHLMVVWKSKSVSHSSMTLPKNSIYYEFFNYNLIKFAEGGGIEMMRSRHIIDFEQDCASRETREPEDVTLSWKKVFSLFATLALGFALATITFYVECISKLLGRRKHPKFASLRSDSLASVKSVSIESVTEKLDTKLERLTVNWSEHDKKELMYEIDMSKREAERLTLKKHGILID